MAKQFRTTKAEREFLKACRVEQVFLDILLSNEIYDLEKRKLNSTTQEEKDRFEGMIQSYKRVLDAYLEAGGGC